MIAHYVCSSGKHYPLEFRRFRKWAACAEDEPASPFKNHTTLFKELVDGVVEQEIPGDFAFDSYFSSAESLNHIQGHQRGYVGDLKSNRKVWSKGREMKATEWAAGIASDDRQRVDIGERKRMAAGEAKPLADRAAAKRQESAQWNAQLRELKRAKPRNQEAVAEVEAKVKALNNEARTLANDAKRIEDTVYDLKAVNPHKRPTVDTRTPEELLDLIEAKGREVAEALAVLRDG